MGGIQVSIEETHATCSHGNPGTIHAGHANASVNPAMSRESECAVEKLVTACCGWLWRLDSNQRPPD
jgi:hypothetical protein